MLAYNMINLQPSVRPLLSDLIRGPSDWMGANLFPGKPCRCCGGLWSSADIPSFHSQPQTIWLSEKSIPQTDPFSPSFCVKFVSMSQNWQCSLRAIPSSTGTSSPAGDRSLFSPLSVFMLSRGWKMKVKHVFPKQFSQIAQAVPFFPPSASPVNCCISILALTSSVAVLPHDVDTSQAVPADGFLHLKNFGNSIATSGLWPSKFSRWWFLWYSCAQVTFIAFALKLSAHSTRMRSMRQALGHCLRHNCGVHISQLNFGDPSKSFKILKQITPNLKTMLFLSSPKFHIGYE